MTLWFPTYVDQITTQKNAEDFEVFCNRTITADSYNENLKSFCGCRNTIFTDMDIKDTQFSDFRMDGVVFSNVTFTNVSFSAVVFNGTEFSGGCQFRDSKFSTSYFNATYFEDVTFDSVSIESSLLCFMNGSGIRIGNSTALSAEMFEQVENQDNVNCEDEDYKDIECKAPKSGIYRDSFFITASALPGNVASAIAVYFLRRNYWLGELLSILTVHPFYNYLSLLF